MSISSNLTKLTTDITNAYTSIENKGGIIPANKNTNNLPTAIDSIEVIEQATAEGESLSLTNTKAMPYSEYVVKGKSEQETGKSKNYFDASKIANSVIVVSDNGKTITLPLASSGNGASSCISKLSDLCPDLQVGDNIYLRFTRNLGNTYNNIIYLVGSGKEIYNTSNTPTTITQQDLDSIVYLYGNRYSDGETTQVILTDFRIVKNATDEFEPYGEKPSPSIPSEIHSVADDVNLFDVDNTTIRYGDVSKKINNNHLILTSTGTTGAQIVQNIISDLDNSKNYILSFKGKKILKGTNNYSYIQIIVYGSNDNNTYTELQNIKETSVVQGQEYSFTSNVFTGYKYYRLYLYNNASNPTTEGEKTDYYDIKFQEGSTAAPYSPYNQGTVTIKQRGKNLFDVSKFASATSNGITLSFNSDGNIVLNQTATAQANFNSSHIDMDGSINTGDMVTLSGGSENVTVAIQTFTSDDTYIGASRDSGSTVKYTIPNNASKYAFNIRIPSGTVLSDYVLKPQLEKGSTATTYEPYQANDYTFQTEPLRSLPNGVKDSKELDGNHKRINTVVFDGSDDEGWAMGRNSKGLYYFYKGISDKIKGGILISDRFLYLNNDTFWTTSTAQNAISTEANNRIIGIMLEDQTITTNTDFKTWLSTHNTEVLYELAEEVIEPLTQNQATTMLDIIKTGSYEGTTNIYTDEDVKPTIGVGYYKKG